MLITHNAVLADMADRVNHLSDGNIVDEARALPSLCKLRHTAKVKNAPPPNATHPIRLRSGQPQGRLAGRRRRLGSHRSHPLRRYFFTGPSSPVGRLIQPSCMSKSEKLARSDAGQMFSVCLSHSSHFSILPSSCSHAACAYG